MSTFVRNAGGELVVEKVALSQIARAVGTPCYVYSRAAIEQAYTRFRDACSARDTLICYALKANSNLAVLNVLATLGAGFDIVSGGELARVIAAGGDPRKVVFSGVGKTRDEIRQALQANILCFNVESAAELHRIEQIAAQTGVRAPISIRVNPDVDPQTHPYISTGLRDNKFGVPFATARELYRHAARSDSLAVAGIDVHIGSQITELTPFNDALDRVLELVGVLEFEGINVGHIDVGGGLGVRYRDETPPDVSRYVESLFAMLQHTKAKILFEPGRAIVGNAGALLTRVEYLKHGEERNFAIVDAAMNDLLRPALYEAWHEIVPVVPEVPLVPATGATQAEKCYQVVGPVCESADFLGKDRMLALEEGTLLAVLSAGAYGMTMSSNYNSRPRAAEVMVDGERFHVVRERESVAGLFAGEQKLP